MHFDEGTYYLSYSHGRWDTDTYCVAYSTSKSPLGPWTFKGKILETDSVHAGPGHHAFFENPRTHSQYIVYHRWDKAKKIGQMPPSRSVCIERLTYAKNGDIVPIKMTD